MQREFIQSMNIAPESIGQVRKPILLCKNKQSPNWNSPPWAMCFFCLVPSFWVPEGRCLCLGGLSHAVCCWRRTVSDLPEVSGRCLSASGYEVCCSLQLQFICSAKVVISVFELDVLKPELLSNYGSVCETRQTNLISKYLLWIVLHPVALSVGGFKLHFTVWLHVA